MLTNEELENEVLALKSKVARLEQRQDFSDAQFSNQYTLEKNMLLDQQRGKGGGLFDDVIAGIFR